MNIVIPLLYCAFFLLSCRRRLFRRGLLGRRFFGCRSGLIGAVVLVRYRRGLGLGARLGFAFLELEADLAVLALDQKRLERPTRALRDKARHQVRLAVVEQLDHLFRQNLLLQDDAAAAEVAGLRLGDAVFAHIGQAHFVDAAGALGAWSEHGLAAEVEDRKSTRLNSSHTVIS